MKYHIKYPVIVHKSEYGYDAECPVLPGCVTQGNTREEATENIKNAISEYFLAVKKIISRKRNLKSTTVGLLEVEV